jgi:hypothetical protein
MSFYKIVETGSDVNKVTVMIKMQLELECCKVNCVGWVLGLVLFCCVMLMRDEKCGGRWNPVLKVKHVYMDPTYH